MLISNKPQKGKPSQTRNQAGSGTLILPFAPARHRIKLLHCLEMPDVGGDTHSPTCAWPRRPSDVMKKMLEDLYAVHDSTNTKDAANAIPTCWPSCARLNPLVAQPVVRVHPETGRKALYVGEGQTTHIVGMTEDEAPRSWASCLRIRCSRNSSTGTTGG